MSLRHALGTTLVIAASADEEMSSTLREIIPRLREPDKPFLYREIPSLLPMHVKEDLEAELEQLPARELRNLVCIIDLTSMTPSSWDIMKESSSSMRPASLVLAFPEVYFIFLVNENPRVSWDDYINQYHFVTFTAGNGADRLPELIQRHIYGFRSWYDPTGFRHFLRSKGLRRDESKGRKYIAVMEEERAYLWMNGYVAYYYNYCVWLLPSFTEAKCVLGVKDEEENPKAPIPEYVMEDIDLRYGDFQTNDMKIMGKDNLDDRKKYFINLEKTKRLFISSSPDANSKYSVIKPFGGIFDKNIKGHFSPKSSGDGAKSLDAKDQKGASGNDDTNPKSSKSDHSAEFVLQAIASELEHRAACMKNEIADVSDAVHGALLAHEAGKLLNDRTMTSALEVLELRHTFEVEAECRFSGVVVSLPVKKRIEKLKSEIQKIIKTSGMEIKGNIKINSNQIDNVQYEIYAGLRRIYSDYGKWEEESIMLMESRRQVVSLMKADHSPWIRRRVTTHLYRYLSHLMESLQNIVKCSIKWILGFTIIYALQAYCSGLKFPELWDEAPFFLFSSAILFTFPEPEGLLEFISWDLGLSGGPKYLFWSLMFLEGVVGLTHLGVLISYIYQQMSRR